MGSNRTERLLLSRPTVDDLDVVHKLHADPRVWTHLPRGRHTSLEESRSMLKGWITDWDHEGIGYWIIRDLNEAFVGVGGIRMRHGCWNIYYRLAPEQWHHGYATEIARKALSTAHSLHPNMPVIINVLERNTASVRVAAHLGLLLVARDEDGSAANAERCIYADRPVEQSLVDAFLS